MRHVNELQHNFMGEFPGMVFLIVLLFALPFIVSAFREENKRGVLVGEFSNGAQVVRFINKISLPLREDNYRFSYELKRGEQLCTLTGELDIKEIPAENECPGTKGRGNISCANSKPMKVRWSMNSCKSGSGKSTGKSAKFFFAYARNQESAFDELDKMKVSAH